MTTKEQWGLPQTSQQQPQMPESNRISQVSSMYWGKITVNSSVLYPALLTFKRKNEISKFQQMTSHRLLAKALWNCILQEERNWTLKGGMGEQRKCKREYL